MPYVSLKLPAGVFRNGTLYQAKGRWRDSHLVRWIEQTIKPIGGWQEIEGGNLGQTTRFLDTMTDPDSTVLTAHNTDNPAAGSWSDVLNNSTIISNKLSLSLPANNTSTVRTTLDVVGLEGDGDWYFELTRNHTESNNRSVGLRARTGGTGPTISEAIVVLVQFNAATTVSIFFQRYDSGGVAVQQVEVASGISFANGVTLRFGMTLTGDQFQAWTEPAGGGARTNRGSAQTLTATYVDADHRRVGLLAHMPMGSSGTAIALVDNVTATTGGSVISGVPRKMIAWKNNAGNAPHLAIGTNSAVYVFAQGVLSDVSPADLTGGGVDSVFSIGAYGDGNYGGGHYGEGDSAQGTFTEAASWQLDNWGEDLLGVLLSDGRILYWDLSAGGLMAVVGGTPPTNVRALVVTPERFVFALGGTPFAGGGVDPRLVRWPDQDTLDQWDPTVVGATAGEVPLPSKGALMCGLRAKNETLLFTDQDLFAAQYIGGELVYSFRLLGSECGIVSRHAAIFAGGRTAWMGQRSFFQYDGYVTPLPCEVSDYVFGSFNRSQRHKVFAISNSDFGEITWFYPSGSSDEIDRYVTWNYRENHWYIGTLRRVSGVDRGAFDYPIMADYDGVDSTLYEHERGFDHAGAAVPFLESGPVEIAEGDQVAYIRQIIPDEATQAGQVVGNVNAHLLARLYPTAAETTNGPYTLANPTGARVAARQVRLRLTEIAPGNWRVGDVRLELELGGRR